MRIMGGKIVLVVIAFLTYVQGKQTLNLTISPEIILSETDLKDCYHKSDPTLTGIQQEVFVFVSVLGIDYINEDHMEFRMHSYVTLTWPNKEINLTFPNRDRPLIIPKILSDCMWKPDVVFPNTKYSSSFTDTVPNIGYKYLPDEEVFYRIQRFMMTVDCPMMFNLYPMDSQRCFLKISLLNYPDDQVNIKWNAVYVVNEIEPLQFYVEEPVEHYVTNTWATGTFSELWLNITFHRRITGSVLNFYLPSTLVVILSWLSFYIDVEAAPARVSLGLTALLTLTTQMVQARNTLPPVQYITCLDIWLFACLSLVFASFMEYSVAYTYRHSSHFGKISTMRISKNDECNVPRKSNINTPRRYRCSRFDKHSRWIFPVIMGIFTIVYLSYMLNNYRILRKS